MKALTTFHLSENTFDAVYERGLRDIIVAKRDDTFVGESVRFCCDDNQQAISAVVALVEYSTSVKSQDVMAIVIKEVEDIDYAICV